MKDLNDDGPGIEIEDEVETAAANPGLVRVDFALYWRCFPIWGTLWVLALPFALYLPIVLYPGYWQAWCVGGGALLANLVYWFQVRMHFWSGNIVACRMISESPVLFGALTDLNKDGDVPIPALRVFRQSLGQISGMPPRMGDRCAAIALYQREKDPTARTWKTFDPKLASSATTDEDEVLRVLGSVPESDWEELDVALRAVGQPFRKGLHLLDIGLFPNWDGCEIPSGEGG